MFNTLAVLALSATVSVATASASAALPIHLHPKAAVADTRISFTLVNKNPVFRDVTVDGRTYDILPGHTLSIKAPLGTNVYAASKMGARHKGEVVVAVTPQVDGRLINMK